MGVGRGDSVDVPRAHADQLPAGHRPVQAEPRWWKFAHDDDGEGRRPVLQDASVRELVGEAHMLGVVDAKLRRRIGEGIATGTLPDQSAAIGRLFNGVTTARIRSIGFEIAGAAGAAWAEDDGELAFAGSGLSHVAGFVHRGRHHRDGPQRHKRARPRHAPRAFAGPERGLP